MSPIRYEFTAEQTLPCPLETVFAFFADPDNLPRLMPAWQQARIDAATYISPPPPPQADPRFAHLRAGTGTRLTLTIRPFPLSPIRARWVAEIEDFRWLEGFCDVQTSGPFAYWRHCHTLTTVPTGTHLRDHVTYTPPLGVLGRIGNPIIRAQLAASFRFRQKKTLELLTAQTAA